MEVYYLTIVGFLLLGYLKENDTVSCNLMMVTTIILVSIVFGFRFEVGVDWFNYIKVMEHKVITPVTNDNLEVGYKLLNIISHNLGYEIIGVVFCSTVLFITFTMFGAKRLDINPYFFFAVVAPYHFVMSGMNYTRQAVALGIFIFALSYLMKNKKLHFAAFILLSGSFHTSALAFMIMLFLGMKKRYVLLVSVSVLPIVVISMLNEYSMYVITGMDNSGLILRVLYLATPVTLLITHLNKIIEFESIIEKRLIYISILSLPFLVSVSAISPVISDRFAYYFILLVTIVTMRVKKIIGINGEQYLINHTSTLMFITSMVAFITWTMFSGWVYAYEFKSYIPVWLNQNY